MNEKGPILDQAPDFDQVGALFEYLKAAPQMAVLSEEQLAQLALFGGLVLQANQKINLTAIKEPKEFAQKHIIDSLSLLPHMVEGAKTLVDIGSGAGFPGLPLAIALPELQVTLLESVEKKCRFLAEAVAILRLPNVKIVVGRAEEYGQKKGRGQFDLATARAVSELPVLLEYALPLLKKGGSFVAYKGPKAQEELAQARGALAKLGGGFYVSFPYTNGSAEQLILLQFVKEEETPAAYPRKAGIPKKNPLS